MSSGDVGCRWQTDWKERREMFPQASVWKTYDIYMNIKLGQAEAPFALRWGDVRISLQLLKNMLKLDVTALGTHSLE